MGSATLAPAEATLRTNQTQHLEPAAATRGTSLFAATALTTKIDAKQGATSTGTRTAAREPALQRSHTQLLDPAAATRSTGPFAAMAKTSTINAKQSAKTTDPGTATLVSALQIETGLREA